MLAPHHPSPTSEPGRPTLQPHPGRGFQRRLFGRAPAFAWSLGLLILRIDEHVRLVR